MTGLLNIRPVGVAAIAVAAFIGLSSAAMAQGVWTPSKNIEVVVGTAPASGIEIQARAIQKIIEDNGLVEQPLTVVNREGGAMSISWAYINQHPGDGHYLAMLGLQAVTNALTGVNPISVADMTPIATIGDQPVGIAVRSDSAIGSFADLASQLRDDPQALSIGFASSRGNGVHIAISLGLKAASVDAARLKLVVFPSSGEAMAALLGGHVDVLAAPTSAIAAQLEAEAVRSLVVSAAERLPAPFAETPTFRDEGVDAAFGIPYGIAGPKDMTADQVAFWDGVLAKVFATDAWQQTAADTNLNAVYLNSADSRVYWNELATSVGGVMTELGLN